MKEISVLSGKGGTGKTSIAGSFAALASNKIVIADCDVDAADMHLILQPVAREKHEFRSGKLAVIEPRKCTRCGLCQELCRFTAINDYSIDSLSCEGCGFCAHVCPENAITMKERVSGEWFVSDTVYGTLVHARLGIAQENSGKLVSLVRRKARELAKNEGTELIISDGPPGTGCPVISSLSGVDLAVLVTEPTLTAIHDFKRVTGVCHHFAVPVTVCINKYDISLNNTEKIEQFCAGEGIPVAGKIPFDRAFTEAIIRRRPLPSMNQTNTVQAIKDIWEQILRMLKEEE